MPDAMENAITTSPIEKLAKPQKWKTDINWKRIFFITLGLALFLSIHYIWPLLNMPILLK